MAYFVTYIRNVMQGIRLGYGPVFLAACFKFYSNWARSLQSGKDAFRDEIPWITFEAKLFLDVRFLSDSACAFEYGSGGSTLYIARRIQHLVSVEHDGAWYGKIRQALADGNIKNCHFELIGPESTSETQLDAADPNSYYSSAESYRGLSFRKYVEAIDRFPDENFDFVIVDGRSRPAALLHSARKVRKGGYLMLDDSERLRYRSAMKMFNGWERHDFYGPAPYLDFFFQTTVWRKPA